MILVTFGLNQIGYGNVHPSSNPMILRLARLGKLMRIVQHLGWLKGFDTLHMLLSAIVSSFSVLVWASLILAAVLTIFAVATHGFLSSYLADESKPSAERIKIFRYFGSIQVGGSLFFILSLFHVATHNFRCPVRCHSCSCFLAYPKLGPCPHCWP